MRADRRVLQPRQWQPWQLTVEHEKFVKQNLFVTNLIDHPKLFNDAKSAIAETYNHTARSFLKSDTSHNPDAGWTGSIAILVVDRLVDANVGDSRAPFYRGGDDKSNLGYWD